jgi:phosphatidylethanolamine/phosphatidyl-N-methylethanolamine N-methyltransferase
MPDDHEPAATRSTAADAQALETQRTYDRIAPLYDLLDGIYERSWKRKLRAELFRHARGRILDAGVGTGCNMPFYPAESEVVGVDTSEQMLGRARQRARELGREVSLRPMNLLSLDFPDASFDTVAVTFVLLCLPDELQEPALRELRRVTKPDGRVLLLDYRMSEKPGLRLWMRCLSPWLKWAFAGRFDAATDRYLGTAGLQVLEQRGYLGDGVTLTVLKPVDAEAPRRSAA